MAAATNTLHAMTADADAEVRRQEALLKTGALQNAILNSANFSSIATDDKGVIQLFNVGAERCSGMPLPTFSTRLRRPICPTLRN
jgi:hypothetical protein